MSSLQLKVNQTQNTGNPVQEIKTHSHVVFYTIALATLLLGLVLGFLSRQLMTPQSNRANQTIDTPKKSEELTLPIDTQKIDDCVDQEGALYIRPQDLPIGPVYMVHNNKVVGLEYMVPKDSIEANKAMNSLSSKGITVDHVDIAPVPTGHAGLTVPHYHINLYTVDRNTQMGITCPNNGSKEMNMPGMNMNNASSSTAPMQMKPTISSPSSMQGTMR